jgi:cell division protein FtsL
MARSERQDDGTRGGVGTVSRLGTRPRPPQPREGAPAAPDPRRGRQPRPVPAQRPVTDQQAGTPQRPDGSARTDGRRGRGVPPQAAAATERGGPQAAAAPAGPGSRRRAARAAAPQRARATGPQPTVRQAQPAQQAQSTQQAQPAQQAQRTQAARAAVTGPRRMPFVLLLCGLLGGALVSALVISTTLAEGSFQISKLQDSTSSLAKQQQSLENEVAQAQSPQRIAQSASQLGMRRTGEVQYVDLKAGKVTNTGPVWSGAKNAPGFAP